MPRAEDRERRGERRLWWQLFGLLATACASWALAAPLLAGTDEASHAVRAAAVVRGELVGRRAPRAFPPAPNTFVEVKVPEAYRNVSRMGDCFVLRPTVTPACAPAFTGGRRLVSAVTYEFRGLPLYYLVVGVPTLAFPAATGVYLMRLIGAAACAALLASGLASALELRARPLLVVGVFVAATPEVLYLAGAVNSNAIEVAAAICLWTSLLAVVRMPGEPSRRLVARAGVALLVLIGSRGLSPLFAFVALLALGALGSRERLRDLARRTDVRAWLAAGAGLTLIAAAWALYIQERYPLRRAGSGLSSSVQQTSFWLRGAVGIFGSNDVSLPSLVYAIWAVVVVVVLALAFATASRRDAAVLVALLAVALGLPVGTQGFNLPPIGFYWQGRYGLPLLVGVAIVATGITDARRRCSPRVAAGLSRLVPAMLGLLVAGQVAAFVWTARRFAVGSSGSRNPIRFLLDARWSPPPGPAALYLALLAGSLCWLAGLVARRATRTGAPASDRRLLSGSPPVVAFPRDR